MTVERVARGAVLLAASAAVIGTFFSSGLASGWLSSTISVAWSVLALIAAFTVRRRFLAGELLIALLAVGPGYSLLLGALGSAGPSPLDAAQTLLMITALVLFAVARRDARSDGRRAVTT